MILMDLSQTVMACCFQNMQKKEGKQFVDLDLTAHMVFATLLSYKKKFQAKYGAPVLAMDSAPYWRKEIFPQYKAHRKTNREESDIDWESVYAVANLVQEAMIECAPWKTIKVPGAEADDVIGVISKYVVAEPTVILSSDKDYKQLQKNEYVSQYSPTLKKWIVSKDPVQELRELIICGDGGDGIPNILSDDLCIVEKRRQKPMTNKRLTELLEDEGKMYRQHKDNYLRNKKLIDMDEIPETIVTAILDKYKEPVTGSAGKLYKFFVAKKMTRLLGDIEQFNVRGYDYNAIKQESGSIEQFLG